MVGELYLLECRLLKRKIFYMMTTRGRARSSAARLLVVAVDLLRDVDRLGSQR